MAVTAPPEPVYRIKGTAFRGHLKYLKDNGKLDAILARVSPECATAIRNPPLSGSWIDARFMDEIVQVLDQMEGTAALWAMERKVIEDQMTVFFPVMQGILRVLGTSPTKVFSRLGDLYRRHIEGVEFCYTPTSDRSGTMEVRFATTRPLRLCNFVTTIPGLELVFQVCGVSGTVSFPEMLGPQSARYQLSW